MSVGKSKVKAGRRSLGLFALASAWLVACTGAEPSDILTAPDVGVGGLGSGGQDGDVTISDVFVPMSYDASRADGPVETAVSSLQDSGGTNAVDGPTEMEPEDTGVDAVSESGEAGSLEAGGDNGSDTGGPSTGDASGPAFTLIYQTVLQPLCASCHSPSQDAQTSANLDLSTQAAAFANLVGVVASGYACATNAELRVAPFHSELSLLYTKIIDTEDCGGPMPPSGALDVGSVGLIKAWIDSGASND